MNNVTVQFRDRDDSFPEKPSIPLGVRLEPDERARRIREHETLQKLLTDLRPDVDPDLWTCATYGELIALAIEALQAERVRVGSYVTPPPLR